jgi:hypothetical protein
VGYVTIWSGSVVLEVCIVIVSLKGTVADDKPRPREPMRTLIYIKQGLAKCFSDIFRHSLHRASLGLWQLCVVGHLLFLIRVLHPVLQPQECSGGAGGLQYGGAGHPGHLHLVCLGQGRQGLAKAYRWEVVS